MVSKQQANRERKAKQRKQQKALGITRVEITLSNGTREKLEKLCNETARPGEEPWDKDELINRLILSADERHERCKSEMANRQCHRCLKPFPEHCDGLFKGDATCFLTKDFKSKFYV